MSGEKSLQALHNTIDYVWKKEFTSLVQHNRLCLEKRVYKPCTTQSVIMSGRVYNQQLDIWRQVVSRNCNCYGLGKTVTKQNGENFTNNVASISKKKKLFYVSAICLTYKNLRWSLRFTPFLKNRTLVRIEAVTQVAIFFCTLRCKFAGKYIRKHCIGAKFQQFAFHELQIITCTTGCKVARIKCRSAIERCKSISTSRCKKV